MENLSRAASPQQAFTLTTRDATAADFEFLYQLKKKAEYDAVEAVFGWDEATQRAIHQQEWDEARPTLIEVNQEPSLIQRPVSFIQTSEEDPDTWD